MSHRIKELLEKYKGMSTFTKAELEESIVEDGSMKGALKSGLILLPRKIVDKRLNECDERILLAQYLIDQKDILEKQEKED